MRSAVDSQAVSRAKVSSQLVCRTAARSKLRSRGYPLYALLTMMYGVLFCFCCQWCFFFNLLLVCCGIVVWPLVVTVQFPNQR